MPDLHVIIKGVLHAVGTEFFEEIPDCVVVEHAVGLVQKERPHYHCWLPNVSSILDTKNRLREFYDKKLPDLKWNTHANAYYTVKDHNDFDAWLNYAWTEADCKLPELKVWNRSLPRPVRSLDQLILPASSVGDVITHVVPPVATRVVAKSTRKDPCHLRFTQYVRDNLIGPNDHPSLDDVIKFWVTWTKGNYELSRVSGPIRYCYVTLSADPDRLMEKMADEIHQKFFSSY